MSQSKSKSLVAATIHFTTQAYKYVFVVICRSCNTTMHNIKEFCPEVILACDGSSK